MSICTQCKTEKGSIKKNVTVFYKDKKYVYQYFLCTECNNANCKKYYHSARGRLVIKNNIRKSYLKFKSKSLARSKLNASLRAGLILKPDVCQKCQSFVKRIQAHHHDYNRPLDVAWLCGKCHWKIDHSVV